MFLEFYDEIDLSLWFKGLSIYYVIRDRGGGVFPGFNHFQYYISFYVVLKVRILSQIWKNFANMRF